MNKIGNIMGEVVNNICPPVKKTIWVLLNDNGEGCTPKYFMAYFETEPDFEELSNYLDELTSNEIHGILAGSALCVNGVIYQLREVAEEEEI